MRFHLRKFENESYINALQSFSNSSSLRYVGYPLRGFHTKLIIKISQVHPDHVAPILEFLQMVLLGVNARDPYPLQQLHRKVAVCLSP